MLHSPCTSVNKQSSIQNCKEATSCILWYLDIQHNTLTRHPCDPMYGDSHYNSNASTFAVAERIAKSSYCLGYGLNVVRFPTAITHFCSQSIQARCKAHPMGIGELVRGRAAEA